MDYTEQIRLIRKSFFAYRNGIIADSLRKCGDPHKSIMGCQWIDIMTIASQLPKDAVLAEKLWQISDSRECRMIAPLLYPLEELDAATATNWAKDVECDEVADTLCQALIGKMSDVLTVFHSLVEAGTDQCDYTAFRLLQNARKRNTVTFDEHLHKLIEEKLQTATGHLRPLLLDLQEYFQQ